MSAMSYQVSLPLGTKRWQVHGCQATEPRGRMTVKGKPLRENLPLSFCPQVTPSHNGAGNRAWTLIWFGKVFESFAFLYFWSGFNFCLSVSANTRHVIAMTYKLLFLEGVHFCFMRLMASSCLLILITGSLGNQRWHLSPEGDLGSLYNTCIPWFSPWPNAHDSKWREGSGSLACRRMVHGQGTLGLDETNITVDKKQACLCCCSSFSIPFNPSIPSPWGAAHFQRGSPPPPR